MLTHALCLNRVRILSVVSSRLTMPPSRRARRYAERCTRDNSVSLRAADDEGLRARFSLLERLRTYDKIWSRFHLVRAYNPAIVVGWLCFVRLPGFGNLCLRYCSISTQRRSHLLLSGGGARRPRRHLYKYTIESSCCSWSSPRLGFVSRPRLPPDNTLSASLITRDPRVLSSPPLPILRQSRPPLCRGVPRRASAGLPARESCPIPTIPLPL